MNEVQVPESWHAIAQELLEGPANILVVGASDVGKSTFCNWLAYRLADDGQETWLVDADVGQSQLGPPGSVGCGRARAGTVNTDAAFFVGDVAPASCVSMALAAFSSAVRAAREAGARHIVVDTTGWISGWGAVALKLAKAAILGEAHVVLIEASGELRAFRRAWRGLPQFRTHTLRPAGAVVRRSPLDRRAFREAAFRGALEGAVECEIDLRQVAVSGRTELQAEAPHLPPGLLLGLNEASGRLLGIGILLSLDPKTGILTGLCRPEAVVAVEVRMGRLYLRPDGTHSPAPS